MQPDIQYNMHDKYNIYLRVKMHHKCLLDVIDAQIDMFFYIFLAKIGPYNASFSKISQPMHCLDGSLCLNMCEGVDGNVKVP